MSRSEAAPTHVPGAVCRDGSPALFRINTTPGSDKLAIFLEQGGACVPDACFTVSDDSVSDEGMRPGTQEPAM